MSDAESAAAPADGTPPEPTADGHPTAGDAQSVPVPHEDSMQNTSEQSKAIDGVFTYPEPAAQESPPE